MENKILLSLCIPTNGIVEWVIPVIKSIYAQGVDNYLFEVVVTDNGKKSDLAEVVKDFKYPNFHYYKTTSEGFLNQIDAFEKCSGIFCKMLNHRSKLIPGSLNAFLDLINRYKETKPILYCAEGYAKGGEFIECDNIDEFVAKMGYWISCSAGTGAWKDDLLDIRSKYVDFYFPHTVFLFELRKESKYVIWNERYEVMSSDGGKGGYDVFYAFGVSLLDIATKLRLENRIKDDTFINLKKSLFSFLRGLYRNEVIFPTKHTYIINNICRSMRVYYGSYYYWKMVLIEWVKAPIVFGKILWISINYRIRRFFFKDIEICHNGK